MKEGPFKVETKPGGNATIAAPGMIITAEKDRRVKMSIDAVAAQLNRAHEAGRLEKRAEDDAAEAKLSETHRVQRDGWRAIAEALIAIGMGYEMRGFGDNPPREILDDILGANQPAFGYDDKGNRIETAAATAPREDSEILESIRDSLVGRAWRVAGNKGKGTCDYPLCPNRAAKHASPGFADVSLIAGAKLHVCTANQIDGEREAQECHRWALWVQQRAAAGRIEVNR